MVTVDKYDVFVYGFVCGSYERENGKCVTVDCKECPSSIREKTTLPIKKQMK